MTHVSITGASGYIGRHLVDQLSQRDGVKIKVLSRHANKVFSISEPHSEISQIQADLLSAVSLEKFLDPECTVVNLAYLWNAGENANLAATRNLVSACKLAKIKRLIHVSTVDVTGRAFENILNESISCKPVGEYGVTKLAIENLLRDEVGGKFDLVILRPSAVFGPGSKNLSMLVNDIQVGNCFKNYLKNCLFGRRRMNLVAVANVVAAIEFLMHCKSEFRGAIFNITDDNYSKNNFLDVERTIRESLGVGDYWLSRIPLPLNLLKLLLKLTGRNINNPCREYQSEKIRSLGFVPPISFDKALDDYAKWCRASQPY